MKLLSPNVIVVLLALSGIPSLAFKPSEPAWVHYRGSRVSMASNYTIDLYGTEGVALPLVAETALDEVDRIDRLMSIYKRDSAVSYINRRAGRQPVVVEPELFDFLQRCLAFSRESEGAFDITVQPLMRVWGFFGGEGRIPASHELRSALETVGYRKVSLDPGQRSVRFQQEGMALDLGGIAKGYAVDRVVSLLKEHRIQRALVSAGGSTLCALGAPPRQKAWMVKVRDPMFPRDSQKSALVLPLKDQCLSISGSYEQFFTIGGATYSHIMDPRRGRPVGGLLSVAVVAESGMEGDALDNALFVMGPQEAERYLRRYPRAQVYFFLPRPEGGWKRLDLLPGSRPVQCN